MIGSVSDTAGFLWNMLIVAVSCICRINIVVVLMINYVVKTKVKKPMHADQSDSTLLSMIRVQQN